MSANITRLYTFRGDAYPSNRVFPGWFGDVQPGDEYTSEWHIPATDIAGNDVTLVYQFREVRDAEIDAENLDFLDISNVVDVIVNNEQNPDTVYCVYIPHMRTATVETFSSNDAFLTAMLETADTAEINNFDDAAEYYGSDASYASCVTGSARAVELLQHLEQGQNYGRGGSGLAAALLRQELSKI